MNGSLDLVITGPTCRGFINLGTRRKFRAPRLGLWSINQAETNELTGQARHDFERELRISALGNLVCSTIATPLWRRICCREMYREIRARSTDQRVAMELVLLESMRRPS